MWQCCKGTEKSQQKMYQHEFTNKLEESVFYELVPKNQSIQNIKNQRGSKIIIANKQIPMNFNSTEKYTKLTGEDYDKIWEELKKKQKNFVDPKFPHFLKSITSRPLNTNIQWRRINQLNDNSKGKTLLNQNISRNSMLDFKYDNQPLTNVLKLLTQKQLLHKNPIILQQNPEGIYAFKLKFNGKITIVVVDDYLPVFKNKLLYSQPINQDYYIPLLEKALAKIYGNYQSIPNEEWELFNVISCLPYVYYPLKKLKNEDIKELLTNKKHFCICKSENTSDQIKQEYFFIDQTDKNKIYLKKNLDDRESLVLTHQQFLQKFVQLHIWILQQQFNSLFFNTSTKKQLYRLDIKMNAAQIIITYENTQQCQNQLLLINQNYQFINASTIFHSYYNNIYMPFLQAGSYYVYCLSNMSNDGIISFQSPSLFQIMQKQPQDNFLQNFFHTYSLTHTETNKYLDNDKLSYIATRMLFEQLNMAYIEIVLDSKYKNKIRLQFNIQQLRNAGYNLLQYSDKQKEVKKILKSNSSTLLKFMINADPNKPVKFPPPILIQQVYLN